MRNFFEEDILRLRRDHFGSPARNRNPADRSRLRPRFSDIIRYLECHKFRDLSINIIQSKWG